MIQSVLGAYSLSGGLWCVFASFTRCNQSSVCVHIFLSIKTWTLVKKKAFVLHIDCRIPKIPRFAWGSHPVVWCFGYVWFKENHRRNCFSVIIFPTWSNMGHFILPTNNTLVSYLVIDIGYYLFKKNILKHSKCANEKAMSPNNSCFVAELILLFKQFCIGNISTSSNWLQ